MRHLPYSFLWHHRKVLISLTGTQSDSMLSPLQGGFRLFGVLWQLGIHPYVGRRPWSRPAPEVNTPLQLLCNYVPWRAVWLAAKPRVSNSLTNTSWTQTAAPYLTCFIRPPDQKTHITTEFFTRSIPWGKGMPHRYCFLIEPSACLRPLQWRR